MGGFLISVRLLSGGYFIFYRMLIEPEQQMSSTDLVVGIEGEGGGVSKYVFCTSKV